MNINSKLNDTPLGFAETMTLRGALYNFIGDLKEQSDTDIRMVRSFEECSTKLLQILNSPYQSSDVPTFDQPTINIVLPKDSKALLSVINCLIKNYMTDLNVKRHNFEALPVDCSMNDAAAADTDIILYSLFKAQGDTYTSNAISSMSHQLIRRLIDM